MEDLLSVPFITPSPIQPPRCLVAQGLSSPAALTLNNYLPDLSLTTYTEVEKHTHYEYTRTHTHTLHCRHPSYTHSLAGYTNALQSLFLLTIESRDLPSPIFFTPVVLLNTTSLLSSLPLIPIIINDEYEVT